MSSLQELIISRFRSFPISTSIRTLLYALFDGKCSLPVISQSTLASKITELAQRRSGM